MIPGLPEYSLHDPYNRLIIVRRSDKNKTTLTGEEAAEAIRQIGMAAIVGLEAVQSLCRSIEAERAKEFTIGPCQVTIENTDGKVYWEGRTTTPTVVTIQPDQDKTI